MMISSCVSETGSSSSSYSPDSTEAYSLSMTISVWPSSVRSSDSAEAFENT